MARRRPSRAGCGSSSSPPCPTAGSGRRAGGRPTRSADRPQLVNQLVRDTQEAHVQYTGTLRPGCWTATAPPATAPSSRWTSSAAASRPTPAAALAYYARLERESDLVFAVSPYRADAHAPPFSFDLSYSYYSPAYERPGPEVRIYRLHDCRQGVGRGAACERGGPTGAPAGAARERAAPRPPGRLATALAVAVVLLVALALRLWNLDHGLPFAYNADEAEHFVPRAIAMLHGSLDPGYYENPPAFTYLLLLVFHLRGGDLARTFAADPEPAFLTARVVVALLGTLGVALTLWAGARFYDRRVGLVAAAVLAVAFLPVFYAKHALNDVVTLVPVTVALVACLVVHRARALAGVGGGGRRDRRGDGDEVHGRRHARHAPGRRGPARPRRPRRAAPDAGRARPGGPGLRGRLRGPQPVRAAQRVRGARARSSASRGRRGRASSATTTSPGRSTTSAR